MNEKITVVATEGFCLGNGVDKYPGDVFDLSVGDAELWIRNKRVRIATEEDMPKKEPSFKAVHRGGGKYAVMQGEEVIVSSLEKEEAEAEAERLNLDEAPE